MAVIKTAVTIYGWILQIVQMLKDIKATLVILQASQDAQSKQLAEIISMLTPPTDPVAFRIELTNNQTKENQ